MKDLGTPTHRNGKSGSSPTIKHMPQPERFQWMATSVMASPQHHQGILTSSINKQAYLTASIAIRSYTVKKKFLQALASAVFCVIFCIHVFLCQTVRYLAPTGPQEQLQLWVLLLLSILYCHHCSEGSYHAAHCHYSIPASCNLEQIYLNAVHAISLIRYSNQCTEELRTLVKWIYYCMDVYENYQQMAAIKYMQLSQTCCSFPNFQSSIHVKY